jgi:hypothetical protein
MPVACYPPPGLAVTNVTASTARVMWFRVPDAVGYRVDYRLAGELAWTNVPTTDTTLTLTGLSNARVYELQVASICPTGTTPPGNGITFSTQTMWNESPAGNLYNLTASLGIGTAAPAARLHVVGSFLAMDTIGGTPVSGPGARVMWIPEKAAFRAGEVTAAQWDDENIGAKSVGIGYNAIASGNRSYAIGTAARATGAHTYAFGRDVRATARQSMAIGMGVRANTAHSIAFGIDSLTADTSTITALSDSVRPTNVAGGLYLYAGSNRPSIETGIVGEATTPDPIWNHRHSGPQPYRAPAYCRAADASQYKATLMNDNVSILGCNARTGSASTCNAASRAMATSRPAKRLASVNWPRPMRGTSKRVAPTQPTTC